MTNDSHLFRTEPGPNRVPLYEGKMIHQFTHQWGEPRYWVDKDEARAAVLGRDEDTGQTLDYQMYRVVFRAVASSTNERSMISTVVPRMIFCGNSLISNTGGFNHNTELLFCSALLNSFVIDWFLRQKVTTNINMFYVYQLPVPRLTESDPAFAPLVERAARLICTTPAYDDLARAVGLGNHTPGVTDPDHRARLRAELDGLIAHVYGLTEEEFRHILDTFPLVEEQVKADALAAYRENGE